MRSAGFVKFDLNLITPFCFLLFVLLCGCTESSSKPVACNAPTPNRNSNFSETTGDYEEGWAIGYFDLAYYGFDQAASLYTKDMISSVDACPFSDADKADFVQFISDSEAQFLCAIKNVPLENGKRPDLSGGKASREDSAKMADAIKMGHFASLFSSTRCVSGGGAAL
jgi:hypothetical protein